MEKVVESGDNKVVVYVYVPLEEQGLSEEEIKQANKDIDETFHFVAEKLSLYLSVLVTSGSSKILLDGLNYFNDGMNTALCQIWRDLERKL